MAGRQTDKYGNPAHHTGHLGAPGTTGAFETRDPLGAPGTTGASPTTGYNKSGGQEQLQRPTSGVGSGHHVPLNATGTTGQGYAYGTAASTGHVGHAQVGVPHTAGLTGTYDTGAHKSDKGTHGTGGYDTGNFGGGTDIGHIGHGRHGAGYDTSVDKGRRGGGYDDILGKGGAGAYGGGYDTGGDKSRVGGYDTLGQGVGGGAHGGSYDTGGGRKTYGQELGGGHGAGSYEAGYDTGGNKSHGQAGVKEHSASGHDTGGDWTHGKEVREHGGKYDTGSGGDKTREPHGGTYYSVTGTGEQIHGGVSATVVEVVTEEPLQEEESKGFIDRIMEHLPGTGGGTK